VTDQVLDLRPRTHADLLHHGPTLADHDLLLRVGLDVEARTHDLLVDLLDLYGNRVWQLLARERKRLLADQLANLILL
jgi:hypothetical protein